MQLLCDLKCITFLILSFQEVMAAPKNLNDLMMAFTDLNATNKSSGAGVGFKGPAMKDVKVEKSTGPSFQPSQKARDWSSLAQNLEDAFVLNSSTSNKSDTAPSFRTRYAHIPYFLTIWRSLLEVTFKSHCVHMYMEFWSKKNCLKVHLDTSTYRS